MPLHIVKQDITKIQCDAIVNAANSSLLGGGGVDGAIHRAAGIQLFEECRTLGGCKTGDAKITKGYKLPCKYVVHTVGPVWRGGNYGEKSLLESCYKKSLALAKENGCQTVSFPLISSGVYGYPKDKALSVAVETIRDFLFENEMTVYIAIFDMESYKIDEELFNAVAEYIDSNYVNSNKNRVDSRNALTAPIYTNDSNSLDFSSDGPQELFLSKTHSNVENVFSTTLLRLINKKGIGDVECCKKANIEKQTWLEIINAKDYMPSKNTIIAFAIALELTLDETQNLLAAFGFTLSKSNKFDLIVEYFLLKGEYDIFVVNETLFKFNQICLGS